MSNEVTAARVAMLAAAARVPIDAEAAERVARAVGPAVARFTAANIALDLEVEPASYLVVARREIAR